MHLQLGWFATLRTVVFAKVLTVATVACYFRSDGSIIPPGLDLTEKVKFQSIELWGSLVPFKPLWSSKRSIFFEQSPERQGGHWDRTARNIHCSWVSLWKDCVHLRKIYKGFDTISQVGCDLLECSLSSMPTSNLAHAFAMWLKHVKARCLFLSA